MEPIIHALVQLFGGADLVNGRPEHVWWVDHDEVPGQLRLVLLDEPPSGLLRERLARMVLYPIRRLRSLRAHLCDRGVVPIGFGEDARLALDGEHGYARGRRDDAFDVRAVGERGLEDACGTLDGRYDELVWIIRLGVEGGCGVLDSVDILHIVVEGAGLQRQ